MTPYELWLEKKAAVDHIKVFGMECFDHIPKQKRRKWDKKVVKRIGVGHYGDKEGYRIWNLAKQDIVLSRDVTFKREQLIPTTTSIPFVPYAEPKKRSDVDEKETDNENMPLTQPDGHDEEDNSGDGTDSDNGSVNADMENITTQRKYQGHILRNRRQLREPIMFHNYVLLTQGTPATCNEAMNFEDGAKWKAAMDAEMQSLMESRTRQLVELREGRKAIYNRWVMRVKLNPDGSIDRYNARLVAKGCSQKAGINFNETFSTVARFDTVRTMLSVAANEGLELAQFDIKTAFLNGEIEEEIYMKKPDSYDDGTTRVCKLFKRLYGLKQSSRCWNRRLVNFMRKNNFVTSNADPCLFVRQSDTSKLIVAIYVDDELIVRKLSWGDSAVSQATDGRIQNNNWVS